MIKFNYLVILLYFIQYSLEQNITNTYENINNKIKKNIINNLRIDLNSSLKDLINSNDVIIDYKEEKDYFILNNQTYIIFPSNNQELSNYADIIRLYIQNYTGLEILVAPNVIRKTSNRNKNTFIQIVLEKTLQKKYLIEISRRKIKLSSNSNIGIKNAIIIIKKILENNFNDKNNVYENVQFPFADIYIYEKNSNFRIIIAIIVTLLVLFISFMLFKK